MTSDVGAGLAAVATLGGIVLWFLKRKTDRDAKADEPIEQNRARKQAIGSEVGRDDERGANASLDDDLRRLHELKGPGDLQRPDSGTNAGGPATDSHS